MTRTPEEQAQLNRKANIWGAGVALFFVGLLVLITAQMGGAFGETPRIRCEKLGGEYTHNKCVERVKEFTG